MSGTRDSEALRIDGPLLIYPWELKKHGPSLSCLLALLNLDNWKTASHTDIAEALGISRITVLRLIRKAVKLNLVSVAHSPGRVSTYNLKHT